MQADGTGGMGKQKLAKYLVRENTLSMILHKVRVAVGHQRSSLCYKSVLDLLFKYRDLVQCCCMLAHPISQKRSEISSIVSSPMVLKVGIMETT